MGKVIKETIHANGIDIGIYTQDFENEFISLTDIARYKSDDPTAVIQNWMRNRDVIEFLGLWERLHNPDFNPLEFEGFRKQAGANAFTMSPKKWIETTNEQGEGFSVDFDALRAENPDTVAWIRFDEPSIISYPVVKSSDNKEYLTKTFSANDNKLGAIFMDMRCDSDFADR